MKDLKNIPLIDLANRLNEIRKERDKLDLEELNIIKECWDRIPSLKDDVNMQPKILKIGDIDETKKH